ncbi:MAG: hypothetical protein WDA16_07135 [Candidatus Thermoplasmatota archaeon]
MRWPAAAALVLLIAAPALAGCFSKPAPATTYSFSAAGGKVSPGWAYDGSGLVPGSAQLAGTLDNTANTGSVNVSFDYAGSKYVVTFDQYKESRPFQDGGVRFEFDEHGSTGNGDGSLPKIHAKLAAWGTAKVTKDDEMLRGGATSDLWNAHLMLMSDAVRGADGKIVKADGTTPYDPLKSDDAKLTTGKTQAMFYIQSPDGPLSMRGPINDSKTLTFQGPQNVQTVDIPAEKGAASVTINVSFEGATPAPIGIGKATVTLKDAGGNTTKTQDVTIAPQQPSLVTFVLEAKDIKGAYKLSIDGTGAFNAKVDTLVQYDDHPFLVITWDEPALS